MNYNNMDLSLNDKLRFVLKGSFISISISYLFYGNLWIGVPIAILFSFSFKGYKDKLISKRNDILLLQFRDLLYSISSSISTGRNMLQSLKESISFWEGTYDEKDIIIKEVKEMIKRIEDSNEEDSLVLEDFANRSGLDDIKNFALTYKNAKETGFDLSIAINHATDIISDKIEMEKELKSSLREKEFESKVVTFAPFIILLFLRLTSKDYLYVFLNTMKGHIIATFALMLIGISSLISERIVKIEI